MWKRIIRVLSHEINNSLAPIKSISGSLMSLMDRNPLREDLQEDVDRGLRVIQSRAEALGRFMATYARLARLPQPELGEVDVAIFAFDERERLQLLNRAGERLLGQPASRVVGRTAADLRLEDALGGVAPRTL